MGELARNSSEVERGASECYGLLFDGLQLDGANCQLCCSVSYAHVEAMKASGCTVGANTTGLMRGSGAKVHVDVPGSTRASGVRVDVNRRMLG